MATLSRLTLTTILSFLLFYGQLGRLNLPLFSFPIIDIFLPIFAVLSIKPKLPFNRFWLIFAVFAVFSNFFFSPTITSTAYLIRLLSIITLFAFTPTLSPTQNKILDLFIFSSIIFGFFQYFFWPDFTYFDSQNWDPHLYRLIGTYYDPTFTGLIFLFFLLSVYFKKKLLFTDYCLLIISYLALALTYSRTSLLAFLVSFLFISLKTKNYQIFLKAFLIVFLTILLLPRMPGEGTKLERNSSIRAKIENYAQGISLFQNHIFTGVGYNRLPQIRSNHHSHANSGFDGSLLTIAVTTGLFGLISLVLSLTQEFKTASFFYQTLLISLLFHSLFSNSLFYPFTSLYLILLKNRK